MTTLSVAKSSGTTLITNLFTNHQPPKSPQQPTLGPSMSASVATAPAQRTVITSDDLEDDRKIREYEITVRQLIFSQATPSPQPSDGPAGPSDDYIEQLAVVLRRSLQDNSEADLRASIDAIARQENHDIELICSGDHNEYMASVQQLEQVARRAEAMRGTVASSAETLDATGQILAQKKAQLLALRTTARNVEAAVDAVSSCLQVLDLTNNVHELLQRKDRFAALRSLSNLQNVHLKEVSDFGFAQLINKSVPALTRLVRDDSLRDIEKWLQHTRQMNQEVGAAAFARTEAQRSAWKRVVAESPQLRKFRYNSPVELAYRESKSTGFSEAIDLQPLYECVLVHTSMGRFAEFQHHFESDRKIQRDYLIPTTGLTLDSVTAFTAVLHNIAGFCIIDRTVSRRLPALRPTSDVDDTWQSLSTALGAALNPAVAKLTSLDAFRDIKASVGAFLHTMEDHGFNTGGIQQLLLMVFKRFSAYLRASFEAKFNEFMQDEKYMPMVPSPQDYNAIVQLTWYKPTPQELARPPPRALPFSEIVPLCVAEVKTFINYHTAFVENLQHDLGQIEDMLRDSLDSLLVDTVAHAFETRLNGPSATREQYVQILVNMEHFEQAARQIENLLVNERISGRRGILRLTAKDKFTSVAKMAEVRIYENISQTVDEFVEDATYNWASPEPGPGQPSAFLVELVSFLRTTVTTSYANVPSRIKSLLYFEAFDHIGQALLAMLDAAPVLTVEAVRTLDVDVKYLRRFVQEVAKSADNSSLMELQQCVNLLLSDDINEYNDNLVRMRKYDLVKPEMAQRLNVRLHRDDDTDSSPASPNPSGVTSQTGGRFMQMYRNSRERFTH